MEISVSSVSSHTSTHSIKIHTSVEGVIFGLAFSSVVDKNLKNYLVFNSKGRPQPRLIANRISDPIEKLWLILVIK